MLIEPTGAQEAGGRAIDGLVDPQSVRKLGAIADPKARAEALADRLEKVFFGMMVKAMRATVPESEMDGKGLGRSQYAEMLDQEYAQMSGLPRDPRFHEALVRQIIDNSSGKEGAGVGNTMR